MRDLLPSNTEQAPWMSEMDLTPAEVAAEYDQARQLVRGGQAIGREARFEFSESRVPRWLVLSDIAAAVALVISIAVSMTWAGVFTGLFLIAMAMTVFFASRMPQTSIQLDHPHVIETIILGRALTLRRDASVVREVLQAHERAERDSWRKSEFGRLWAEIQELLLPVALLEHQLQGLPGREGFSIAALTTEAQLSAHECTQKVLALLNQLHTAIVTAQEALIDLERRAEELIQEKQAVPF